MIYYVQDLQIIITYTYLCSGDLLLTHDLMDHCTKDVQITAPSKKGILPLDRPGQNKGGVSDDIDSAHVDLMTTQLTAPIANVLIQVINPLTMVRDKCIHDKIIVWRSHSSVLET